MNLKSPPERWTYQIRGGRKRTSVILRLRKMQALRKLAKQGKRKQPPAVYAYRFKSSDKMKNGLTKK